MISIIIPVYNEEATIEEVINRLQTSLSSYDREFVVVDDGSRDRTAMILDTLSYLGRARVVRHSENRGKGEAIKLGLREVRGEITVIQDGDLEYDPSDLPALIAEITEKGEKVVYGSRNLKRGNHVGYRPFLLGGKFLSFLTTILFGFRITDVNTGYKVFRTDLLKSLNLESSGFEFCEEVTAKILKMGVGIKELPISYRPRQFSEGKKIRAVDGLKAVLTLIKYRFQS